IKQSVSYEEISKLIEEYRSALLKEFSLKSIYRSEKIKSGYQNTTLNFVYRDFEKTVDQETVDKEHNQLITKIVKNLSESIL
ncbi:MAG: hypothetical protein Q8K92_01145, partial [Leadbetterella sp.]|nr:hypothetical protein [Leadbetterella sp.]